MLRKLRIAAAVVCFALVTLLFLDFTGTLHAWFGWLARIQFLPALLAVNVGVVAALVVATLLFGRIYCSVVCPLGVMQDGVSWAAGRHRKNRFRYSPAKTALRYTVLALFIAALAAGIGSLVALLAPYSAYGRIAQNLLAPLWGWGNNLLAYFAERIDSYAFYRTDVWVRSAATFAVAAATFALIAVLAWRNGRTWCNTVCPVGTVLGFLARFSLLRPAIDTEKCVRCGRCMDACSFSAIIRQERPCKKACGIAAIGKDELGRAAIDYKKCTSCGQCLVNCPFGAISDKSQIFQTIMAIKSGVPVYVVLAPAFVGQFGPDATPEKMTASFKRLGFTDVYEAAIGADLCVIEEAADFLEEVPSKHRFMVTSCCPSWSDMVKKMFPDMAENISVAMTPMVLTARFVKKTHPGCKVVFVGPCDAKKLEASRRTVRSDVDFVLTFEEVLGMFAAKGVDKECIPAEEAQTLSQAGSDARKFAVSGGVAQAVINAIKSIDPTREVKIAKATGLHECRKLLMMARDGKYDGYLLEGMACPGGCVAGAGTLQPIDKSTRAVAKFADCAEYSCAYDTQYKDFLPLIEEKTV